MRNPTSRLQARRLNLSKLYNMYGVMKQNMKGGNE